MSGLQAALREFPPLLWAALYFFCLLAGYYILRPVRDALGSTQNLQLLFTGTFIAMLLLQPVYGAIVSRFPRRVFLPVVYVFFIACLVFFWWVFNRDFAWKNAAFFIWVAVFNLFAVTVFWSYMADVFRNVEAKRLYGYIGAGGTLGGLTGPILTRVLVEQVGVANLLLVSAALIAVCFLCILKLGPYARQRELAEGYRSGEEAMGGGVLAGLRLLWERPVLRAMALLMFCGVGVGTLLYFEQARIASTLFENNVQRTAFYSTLDTAINLTTLLVQLFLTRFLLVRYGIAPLLLMPAFAILLGYCLLAAAPLPLFIAIVQVATRAGEFSLAKPARETVYTRVDRESRYKAKAMIDTVVYRGSDLSFAWIHKGLAAFGSTAVFATGAVLAAGLAAAAFWLVRLQSRALPEEQAAPAAVAPANSG
ncbi:MAG: MFS transporter [Aquimonas sp.]|nr:MFS transporter [Aquimonas sp.]